jgi:hypothetical protein
MSTQLGTSTGPTFTPRELTEHSLQRRAIEAVVWGMPAVNFDLMYQAMVRETHGDFNEIVYWSRLPDWKNQTLTPNPDAIYLMPFFNGRAGAVVVEIPPADEGVINGTIMDAWQTPLEDVGPAGADAGKGGKYLILPPDFEGKLPDDGYIVLPADTYQGYALLRSIPASGSDADVAKAVAYSRRIRLYPLERATSPPETTFRDAIDVVYDATIPYDWRFFEALDRFVQRETWLTRDKAMIDELKSIGIEKGKPFRPDEATRAILDVAAAEAHALLEMKYESLFSPPYFDTSRWAVPAMREYLDGAPTHYADPDSYPIDSRGILFSFAFFTAKRLGRGQYYLMTIRDRDGETLHGAGTYRLSVPAHAPVKQYWSATVYDRATHALIRGLPRGSRSSQNPDLKENADGSVDVYFGPKAPPGKESNWVPTKSDGDFEVLFRFYGPEKALFEKTWKLPDVEPLH